MMEELSVGVSYKKLWKLLIDRDLKKKDLCAMAHISSASLTKMKNNGTVTTDVLSKICNALDCDFSDIMELLSEEDQDNE
jgi:putative transcriptional regulator